jgi:integrase/recombinase XerD
MQWQTGIEDFLRFLESDRNASLNTILAYKNDLGQFAEYLQQSLPAEADWASVLQDHLSDYVDTLAGRGYTTSTIARKIAAIKTLFHWLNQRGAIHDDPSVRLKSPRVEKRAPRLLTPEEVNRLFEAASAGTQPRSSRDRALLEVIYSTGMRVSEAINLRLSDVDLDQSEVRCLGRGNRERRAPLLPRTVAALREYLSHARPELVGNAASDYVFLNPQGARLTRQAVWQVTRQYSKAADIEGDVTPHTLRHSRAAHMLDGGEDVRRVQEWLGHANLATTQMYQQRSTDKPAAPAARSEALTVIPPQSAPDAN